MSIDHSLQENQIEADTKDMNEEKSNSEAATQGKSTAEGDDLHIVAPAWSSRLLVQPCHFRSILGHSSVQNHYEDSGFINHIPSPDVHSTIQLPCITAASAPQQAFWA